MNMLDKLDQLMEAHGINKNQLAEKAGIPKTTIYGWYKKGYEGIRQPTLQKLCDYFNVSMEYLTNDDLDADPGEGVSLPGEKLPFERRVFYNKVAQLSDSDFRMVNRIVDEVLRERGE